MRFFEVLCERNLINDLAPVLDWLFYDYKFSDNVWKNKIQNFTKKVKRLNHVSKDNQHYGTLKSLNFTFFSDGTYFIFANGDSEGKDLLRHIINEIAHSHAEVEMRDGECYVRLSDYSFKNQTSNMRFRLSFLV